MSSKESWGSAEIPLTDAESVFRGKLEFIESVRECDGVGSQSNPPLYVRVPCAECAECSRRDSEVPALYETPVRPQGLPAAQTPVLTI